MQANTIIIGAGIHGLSTAWHLAKEQGSGDGIVILDKTTPGAGATGVACGVVRNYYVQHPMGALMAASVDIWEANSQLLGYHPSGYLAVAPDVMVSDLEEIHARHESLGYPAKLVTGHAETDAYMKQLFPDWQAPGLAAVLHESRGGFAFADTTIQGLVNAVTATGVKILEGVEARTLEWKGSRVVAVDTNVQKFPCDKLVLAVGPWIKSWSEQIGLESQIGLTDGEGHRKLVPMWTYQHLQEGVAHFPVLQYVTSSGAEPPVVHVDSDQPLRSDRDGRQLTDELWGIYFKRDRDGIQGGSVPIALGPDARVDPYGPQSPYHVVDEAFGELWTSGLAHCFARFEGISANYVNRPSGGIGAFSPDSFPVFDWFGDNLYVIADSNHGFKMLAVGREVARELGGEGSAILEPFSFGRFEQDELFATSNSPYPWT